MASGRLASRPLGDGTAEFRVWAPRAESIALRVGRREHALDDAGYGIYEAVVEAQAPATSTAYVGRRATRCPIPARAPSPRGCAARRACSTSRRAERSADARIGRARDLRAARRDVHRRGHVRGRRGASGRARRDRRDRDRGDAGGGVPRAPRLGVRRRVHLGAALGLRRPDRPREARRRRARARAGGDPRRRLQPRRRLRGEGTRAGSALTSRPSTRPPGARRSTSTGPTAIRCASGCCRAPRAGSATTTSTGCGSTRSTRSTTRAPTTSSPRSCARVHAVRDDAWVIAESGLNDPRVMRAPELGGYGLQRRRGPTTSTTRCAPC